MTAAELVALVDDPAARIPTEWMDVIARLGEWRDPAPWDRAAFRRYARDLGNHQPADVLAAITVWPASVTPKRADFRPSPPQLASILARQPLARGPLVTPEEAAAAWERTKDVLRHTMDDATYDLWIAPLAASGYRNGALVLEAPEVIAAWVGSRLYEVLTVTVGGPVTIQTEAS